MGMRQTLLLSILALAAGCSQFPELGDTISASARNAPYPELVPVESLRSGVAPTQIKPETKAETAARAARLRARAARLRGSVIDSPARNRMATGVQ